jgi:hypothetical protein
MQNDERCRCHANFSPGNEDEVYRKLLQVDTLTVFKKEDIPLEFHYRDSRRITPIVIMARPGFHICLTNTTCRKSPGIYNVFLYSFSSIVCKLFI